MFSKFWENRAVLGVLHAHALARGFLRYRNPLRRAAWAHREAFYERAWREAAAQLGAECVALGSGVLEIRRRGAAVRVADNACPIDDPVAQMIAGDKALTYQLLQRRGLPVPRHATFSLGRMAPAVAFVEQAAADCVVKPARDTGGGRGVTTGVRTRSHLARGAAAAAVYGDDLLIEEQVAGDNYRLLYLDGKLLDAFVRRPPSVVGDGRSSIARLVREANEARLRSGARLSQVLITVDLDMTRTLAGQGLTLRSVPEAGAEVALKTVVNENCGVDNATATHLLCGAVIDAGAAAAAAVGVRLAGIDVITTDPTRPLARTGGVILEVNTPPNYYFHYHKRDGAFPVAVHVLDRMLGGEADPGAAMTCEMAAFQEPSLS